MLKDSLNSGEHQIGFDNQVDYIETLQDFYSATTKIVEKSRTKEISVIAGILKRSLYEEIVKTRYLKNLV